MITKKCLVCDKNIQVSLCQIKDGRGKYCSRVCYIKGLTALGAIRYARIIKNRIIKCVDCGMNVKATGIGQKMCKECAKNRRKARLKIYDKKRQKAKRKGFKLICIQCSAYTKPYKKLCQDCRTKNRLKKRENDRIYLKERRLKLRFQIFQRDNFTCQYCGKKVPDVILEIDHIFPKSRGGLDKKENYITACKECNIGKGDAILKEFRASS